MPDYRYNARGLSPKAFLLEVMWAEDIEMVNRIQAADALTHWIQAGDFREPDLTYRVGEFTIQ